MSEKIYALLFWLFPSRFRAAWHEDALDLFCQRAQRERGFVPRLRLWFELIADLASSVPHEYLREERPLVPASAPARNDVPTFLMLDGKPIVRSSAYFYGTLLSFAILLGISQLAKHAGHFPIVHASDAAEASGITMDPWATGASADGDGSTLVIGNGADGSHAARPAAVRPITKVVHVGAPPPMPFFDGAEKHRVLLGVAQALKQHYPDQTEAQKLGKSLLSDENLLARTSDPDAFATAVTRRLRADSQDMHFEVAYIRQEMQGRSVPATVIDTQYRTTMRQANCMMEASVLPHNIGYLKLDWFAEPEVCGQAAIAAMKKLGSGDALIIDLRENSGGSPAMVMFLAGWLFDRPAYFWNPRENSAAGMWTHSPMAGSQLAHKPVFVLTSSQTYSAAEHFSYDLKMLHRATLIGETTAGATDVGMFYRVDEHFGIGLRASTVRNPYPAPDWAVNGVQPDVAVPAATALDKAQKLVLEQLARR
ncbi:MAG TPA: S41 family peptidase [Terracidiphilus sp.]|jgi:hypothetical protein